MRPVQSRRVEMRTVAGPSSVVQWVLSGGPVYRVVAGAAGPGGVPATVTEARLVADQHLIRAEHVSVGASAGWPGYPLAVGGSDELTCTRQAYAPGGETGESKF